MSLANGPCIGFRPESYCVQAILRPFHYAIVDEADSLLIDDCRNPLIISAEPDNASNERFLLAHKVLAPIRRFLARAMGSSATLLYVQIRELGRCHVLFGCMCPYMVHSCVSERLLDLKANLHAC